MGRNESDLSIPSGWFHRVILDILVLQSLLRANNMCKADKLKIMNYRF